MKFWIKIEIPDILHNMSRFIPLSKRLRHSCQFSMKSYFFRQTRLRYYKDTLFIIVSTIFVMKNFSIIYADEQLHLLLFCFTFLFKFPLNFSSLLYNRISIDLRILEPPYAYSTKCKFRSFLWVFFLQTTAAPRPRLSFRKFSKRSWQLKPAGTSNYGRWCSTTMMSKERFQVARESASLPKKNSPLSCGCPVDA